MAGPTSGQPPGRGLDVDVPAWLLTPLTRRIAAGREDASTQRDPEFIRKLLPAIGRYASYFSPDVRGLDRLPADGPALVVGNHSCLFYMPEVWVTGQAIMSRRGISAPTNLLAYDLLFGVPGVGPALRRLGAVPASNGEAEAALERGSCVLVYPGGDLEACRPWTMRNQIEFAGRKGFVRLALRSGVPVVPVVTHGAHHAIVILTRGDRLARAAGLRHVRVKVFPLVAGAPFGINSFLTPPLPMPSQLTLEFLPPLDWTGHGPDAAGDPDVVSACYEEITQRMQTALDRLAAEIPHPVLSGSTRLAARAAAAAAQGAANLARAAGLG